MRPEPGDGFTAEDYAPLSGGVKAGNQIENRGFARPVRSYKASQIVRVQSNVEVGKGLQAAKLPRKTFYFQQSHLRTSISA
jgi:hypothetical protein